MELLVKEIVNAVNGTLLTGSENQKVTSVGVNSKEIKEGALFVPIIGERVDGHQFIRNAFENGAVASFTSHHKTEKELLEDGDLGDTSEWNNRCVIYVEDTLQALQALGAYYRNLFTLPIIGITGSVGKTTTKEMISAALETKYHVLKTIGNMNSQIGLPLMMFYLEKDYDVAVIEMGMSEEGEMERLAKIARPDMAVMTNIGVSHIGQLGSKENIRKEKLNIINEFRPKSKLFLNGDDTLLLQINPKIEIPVTEKTAEKLADTECIFFGTEKACRFYGNNIKTEQGKTYFTLHYPDGTEEIELSVLGLHNVNNALVALAVAYHLGIKPAMAKEGLRTYQPIAMRGQIFEHKGIYIIDDTYNASPDSMKSGISVLLQMPQAKRHIAVLADVLELGEVSHSCHYEVGSYIASTKYKEAYTEEVVTIGKEAKAIKEAIETEGKGINARSFNSNQEAIAYLKTILKPGDAVLVKGSRGMHTDEIVDKLKAL
ncbi:UDP-N-acetylmuramoyl-tripeptide--D-alanyl-D-alanine ligase [Velocimicrobium porci]|uniref:UDP-N-acetylmuramoyl-tripeptide--D-alanyl-D-alanine ligase n=1 Tax=Velocimicrobium porci TaxID=2606634 RepID=A0A6L5XW59_9FIRM|nr:UDP-N-acetylmuramoyl-tripeptide--D-alanyl-D-alanine ligase [Velocimicrobium porci]MSS63055.1 UDP-N-acetylmuramoyl-tripeptide--D-alanyl-D-alanine ligase [Velocimicrobium porci]